MQKLGLKDGILVLYSLVGLAGTIAIIDDLDTLRLWLTSFVAIPSLVFVVFMRASYPQIVPRLRWLMSAMTIASVVIFGWGNVLLLNAVGDGQEQVEVPQQVGNITGSVAHYRGPLGIIYRSRF